MQKRPELHGAGVVLEEGVLAPRQLPLSIPVRGGGRDPQKVL